MSIIQQYGVAETARRLRIVHCIGSLRHSTARPIASTTTYPVKVESSGTQYGRSECRYRRYIDVLAENHYIWLRFT